MQSPPAPSETKPPRSFFWLAFAIGFALLTVVSCGGAAMLAGLDTTTLAELQASGPAWTPPPPAPTVLAADAVVPSASTEIGEAGRLQPNSLARNAASSRVNIRRSPGYLGKGDDDIVAQMEPDATVTIVEWPQVVDQLIWWRIRYESSAGTVEGWVAESTASGVLILAPQ